MMDDDGFVEFFRSSWGAILAHTDLLTQHPGLAVAGGLVLVGVLGRASWSRARG